MLNGSGFVLGRPAPFRGLGGVEGTDDFGDCLGRYGGVAGGGVDAAMAEQDLDGAGVGAIFEQVSGEAVTAMPDPA